MKLYFSPGACSLSPHIVLRETGLPFDLERVDLKAKKLKNGADYYQINPKGQVPLLALDDGDVLTEGPAIVQYIADKAPASGLIAPAGSKERYRTQEWLNFITSELHKNFSPLFRPNTPEDYKPIAKDNLANRFAYVDNQVATRPYLMGDKFTVADAYLFTMLKWAKFQSIDLTPRPNLIKFMERVGGRPKVEEALRAEGLLEAA
jgi:glutathione S-transferase